MKKSKELNELEQCLTTHCPPPPPPTGPGGLLPVCPSAGRGWPSSPLAAEGMLLCHRIPLQMISGLLSESRCLSDVSGCPSETQQAEGCWSQSDKVPVREDPPDWLFLEQEPADGPELQETSMLSRRRSGLGAERRDNGFRLMVPRLNLAQQHPYEGNKSLFFSVSLVLTLSLESFRWRSSRFHTFKWHFY